MNDARPDTVVLVHGLWMTPRSWENWVQHYQAKGLTVLTPGYGLRHRGRGASREPRHHREPDRARNRRPPGRRDREGGHTAGHHGPLIRRHPPQLLLARGLGSAGVAIDSAPTEGVRVNPLSQVKSLFPALKEPGQPAQGRRIHARGVPLRLHQHPHRGRLTRGLGQVCDPRPGQLGVGVRALRQLPSPATRTPGSTTPPTAPRCCSSAARRTTSCRRR